MGSNETAISQLYEMCRGANCKECPMLEPTGSTPCSEWVQEHSEEMGLIYIRWRKGKGGLVYPFPGGANETRR